MATTSKAPISERVQITLDKLQREIDNWTDEKTLESIIETQQRIARYEREHRMSSAIMSRKVISGEIDETHEMVSWAFELVALDHLLAEYP